VPEPFLLRSARVDDADAIASLHALSWQRTYRRMMTDEFLDRRALVNRRQVWHERLRADDGDQFVSVVEHSGWIVGFICAYAHEDPVWGSYIDNLHVSYDWHGQGLGRALMRSVARWLSETAPRVGVYLWVMEANVGARAFYDHLGATNAGTEVIEDPGGGRAPNCRYVWPEPRVLLKS
jgi:ribosomal protein S18 acetylase RimI-like enzyme